MTFSEPNRGAKTAWWGCPYLRASQSTWRRKLSQSSSKSRRTPYKVCSSLRANRRRRLCWLTRWCHTGRFQTFAPYIRWARTVQNHPFARTSSRYPGPPTNCTRQRNRTATNSRIRIWNSWLATEKYFTWHGASTKPYCRRDCRKAPATTSKCLTCTKN